jgi:hypothetical protein
VSPTWDISVPTARPPTAGYYAIGVTHNTFSAGTKRRIAELYRPLLATEKDALNEINKSKG